MWRVYWLVISVFQAEHMIWNPVLVCSVLFFLGVRRGWFVDKFCWPPGSGCGDEFVENRE